MGSKASAHTVFAHVPAAFMEAAGADENCPRAPSKAGAAYVAERGTGEASVMSDINGAGALEVEWLKHASSVVDGERVVPSKVAKLVEDVERKGPFGGFGYRTSYLLLANVSNYCFGLRLDDDDMARIDDGCVGNDAVRHAVRGYVRCIVTDVG